MMATLMQKVLSKGNSAASMLSTYKGLAVMLIDMQEGFMDDIFQQDQKTIFEAHSKIINELCVENYVPLINVMYSGCGGRLHPDYRQNLSVVPILKSYQKINDGAFLQGKLANKLKKMNIDTLFMMGIFASACVYKTALGAKRHGFNVFTSDDVLASSICMSVVEEHGPKDYFVQSGINYYDSHEDFLNYVKKNTKFSNN